MDRQVGQLEALGLLSLCKESRGDVSEHTHVRIACSVPVDNRAGWAASMESWLPQVRHTEARRCWRGGVVLGSRFELRTQGHPQDPGPHPLPK